LPIYFFPGDSGYPLEPWLMTPFINPATPAEQRYNLSHSRTRNTVERLFGVMKNRFRCLGAGGPILQYTPSKVCKIITVAAVLQNICVMYKVPPPDGNEPDDDNMAPQCNATAAAVPSAIDVRRQLATDFFS
jgi:hypothetical protein